MIDPGNPLPVPSFVLRNCALALRALCDAMSKEKNKTWKELRTEQHTNPCWWTLIDDGWVQQAPYKSILRSYQEMEQGQIVKR